MRAEVRDKLSLETDDFFIDTEIVAARRKWNFRIGEKGVRHYPRVAGETTVAPGDVVRTLKTIARMWRRIYMPSESQRDEAESDRRSGRRQGDLPADGHRLMAYAMDEGFYEEYFRDRGSALVVRRPAPDHPRGPRCADPEPPGRRRAGDPRSRVRHRRDARAPAGFGAVRGLDADERAVEFCRARGEQRVELLESDRLPLPDDSVDLVTALDVLEHIEDDRGALRRDQAGAAAGRDVAGDRPGLPLDVGPAGRDQPPLPPLPTPRAERKIAASGLELRRITHFNTLLLPIIAGIRVARRLRPPREVRSDFQLTGGSAVNGFLAAVFSSEARLLARGNLPAGVSILALATAPGG